MPDRLRLADPASQVQQLTADARLAFALDVDALLIQLRVYAESFPWGPVHEDALLSIRSFVLEKFNQHVGLKPAGDPVLLQLLREAFEIINDPDTHLDLRDWTKEARKVLQAAEGGGG